MHNFARIRAKPELRVWLCQVRCTAAQRRELSDLAEIFHGSICDVSLETVTLELQVPFRAHADPNAQATVM